MTRDNIPLLTFNRGRISSLGQARVDLDRTRLSAEIQTNFMPRTLGSMMLRPGLKYVGQTNSNLTCRLVPFVFSSTNTALIELTSTAARFWVNDSLITRSAVSASATNGAFGSNITGWTDADESGASSTWITGGYMELVGTKYSAAIRRQQIAVPATDANVEHGIRVVVERGAPYIKIGSALGNDNYVSERLIRPGTHSFAVTPSSDIYIELKANTYYGSLIDSVSVETTGGTLNLPTPWGASDLSNVRWDQSGDVVFMAGGSTVQPRRIERHDSSSRSWSVVKYDPEDGPFRNPNTGSIRLTPSGLTGDITLSAAGPFYSTNHVGALFRLTSVGQQSSASFTGADQWSNAIRISGVDDTRIFNITVYAAGSTVATVRVQRSIGETGSWGNVTALSWTSSIATTHDDGLDNQIVFYRIGVGSTDYTSGTAAAKIDYSAGGLTGVARITSVTSSTFTQSTAASAAILEDLGSTAATDVWSEGDWSLYRGYPSAVGFHEGRLWWAGKGKIWGSVSDAYESFDPDTEGDSGPLNRSIASGPVDTIKWMMSLSRLLVGTAGREIQCKTSSLEEPLTPTNFNLRDISTQGSANVQAIKIDKRALFTQQGGTRVEEIGFSGDSQDLETADRTILVPEVGEPSIVRMAVQRQPDTRVHCVRGSTDGRVAVLVSDPAENVAAWVDVETGDANGINGVVEEVAVLPGTVEDAVYYVVKREINGSTKRYLERWGLESEAKGGSTNKIADSFLVQNSTATTTVSGLDHLVGSSVIAWGSSKDLGSYTVSSTGTITLSEASTFACVGLPYTAWFKSAKLARTADGRSTLIQKKKVNHLGIVMANVHQRGLSFGPATSTSVYPLDPLPALKDGTAASTDAVHTVYDEASFAFPGSWDTDSRVVLKAVAPRPVTVLGMVVNVESKEKN